MVARLRRPGFIRDVLILAGGAAGAQAINVAISPILTRFFKPTEIGTLGLFLSFIYVAAIVLSLRYEQAIVVPKDEAVAARVAILAAGLVPVVAPLAALILLGLIAFDVAGYGSLPTLVVPLAVVALLATGWFGVVRYWLIRGQAYRVISEVQFAQAVGRAVGQVVLGIAGLGVTGLLVADAVGRYVGLGRMVGAVRLAIVRLRDSTSESYRSIAREHWRFPAFGVPSSLMNAAVVALPVPLLAGTYGLVTAGYFALVQRVLGLPLTIIGASVGDALLARMSRQAHDDPAAAIPFFRRTGLGLALVATPIAGAVALLGCLRASLAGCRPDGGAALAVVPCRAHRQSAKPHRGRLPGPGLKAPVRRRQPRGCVRWDRRRILARVRLAGRDSRLCSSPGRGLRDLPRGALPDRAARALAVRALTGAPPRMVRPVMLPA